MDNLEARYASLPSPLVGNADFALWSRWIEDALDKRRYGLLGKESAADADERRIVSWRACLARWGGGVKKDLTVAPEHAVAAAIGFMKAAHDAPSYVARAARLLLERSMLDGVTSVDVLYLAAAYAWPLEEFDAAFSRSAWEYLVHAPWQTDSSALTLFCDVVQASPKHGGDRTLLDLANHRAQAGCTRSAQELLEAIAALHSGLPSVIALQRDSLSQPENIPRTGEALRELARIYLQDESSDGVHVRSLFQFLLDPPTPRWQSIPSFTKQPIAVAISDEERRDLAACVTQRVWNLGFEECFKESEKLQEPHEFEEAIERAKSRRKLHYARRLAESVVVRHLGSQSLLKRNSSERLRGAFDQFAKRRIQNPVARCALEHLAVLYVRTGMRDPLALEFLDQVTRNPQVFRPNFADETGIVRFVQAADPYLSFTEEDDRLQRLRAVLGDTEKRAIDRIAEWKGRRSRDARGEILRRVTGPEGDAENGALASPKTIDAVEAALRTCLQQVGGSTVEISSAPHISDVLTAIDQAHASCPQWVATAARTYGVGASPKGVSPNERSELGLAVVVATAAAARAVAAFGFDPRTAPGRTMISDSLAAASFDRRAGGLLSYASSYEQTPPVVVVGRVKYDASDRVGHLWVHERATADESTNEGALHLSLLCAIGLEGGNRVEFKQNAGTLLSHPTNEFVDGVVDAAIHLAARRRLLAAAEVSA